MVSVKEKIGLPQKLPGYGPENISKDTFTIRVRTVSGKPVKPGK